MYKMNIEKIHDIYLEIIKGTECPLGYYGRYCNIPCQFPYYGVSCQQTCACSSKNCNFTSGCLKINASKWQYYHIIIWYHP